MRRGKCYKLACCLLGLVSFSALYSQSPFSGNVSISNLQTIPEVLVDTQSYALALYVVNHDPVLPLVDPVSILLSVDGDAGTKVATNVVPQVPVAPGDSFLVYVPDYRFDRDRFLASGGGITYDIIVWPITVNTTQPDSSSRTVYYIDTTKPFSESLGIASLSFPHLIIEGNPYDLSFMISNEDSAYPLYQPLDLYMQVDQGSPVLLTSGFFPSLPLLPGAGVLLDINNFVFPAAAFAGGSGIAHDIIVWPLKHSGTTVPDSAFYMVEYLAGAAFSISKPNLSGIHSAVNPFQGYSIDLSTKNVGSIANTDSVGFYVQLDAGPVYLLETVHQIAAPNGTISANTTEFELADFFGFTQADSNFFSSPHTLSFFAKEIGGLNWYRSLDLPVTILVPQIPCLNCQEPVLNTTGTSTGNGTGTKPMTLPSKTTTDHLSFSAALILELNRPHFQPNPVVDQVFVTIPHSPQSHVMMRIYNASYVLIQTQSWIAASPATNLILDMANWQSGIYFYQVAVGEAIYSGKLIKQ